jgi:hypothetical protein
MNQQNCVFTKNKYIIKFYFCFINITADQFINKVPFSRTFPCFQSIKLYAIFVMILNFITQFVYHWKDSLHAAMYYYSFIRHKLRSVVFEWR